MERFVTPPPSPPLTVLAEPEREPRDKRGAGGGGGKKFRGNFPAKEGGRRIIINVCAGEREGEKNIYICR